ncbi:MAG: family 16 glycosylhydrolase [Streptosporangiales bacterium]|nr:family 16 glycosylhydrolase [Streptosporangiales bacterium]
MVEAHQPDRRKVMRGGLAVAAALAVPVGGRAVAAVDRSGRSEPKTFHLHHDFNTLEGLGIYRWDNGTTQGPRHKSNVYLVDKGDGDHFVRVRTRYSRERERWESGGFKVLNSQHRYGRIRCRIRISASNRTRGAGLLWPQDGCWPVYGELDFYEFGEDSPDRTVGHITNHFGDRCGQNEQEGPVPIHGDFTKWHTVEVLWRPGRWRVFIDGTQVWTTTRNVPSWPMWLGFQTALATAGPRPRTPTYLDIDWVDIVGGPA